MSEVKPNKIYMKQNQSLQEQNVNKDIKGEVKEELLESSLQPLFNGMEIMQVGDMVNITMPLSLYKIFSMFFKKLNLQMDKGVERC